MAAILVLGLADARRAALADALDRRFGRDYEVVVTDHLDADHAVLQGAAPVAVVVAPLAAEHLKSLQVVSVAYPTARRVAVIEVGDTSVAEDLGRAMTLGHVDYYIGHPWASPEEEMYPVVGEALRVWAHDQQLRFPKLTLVTAQGDERGEKLVVMLRRNRISARVLAPDDAQGAQLMAGDLAGCALPALQLWDGRVLSDPSTPELAEALGAHTRPARERYDVAIVGTGPAGLAAATYASSEGLSAVAVESTGVGGQASTSAKIRNYLGFPWGVRGADLADMAGRQAEQLGAEIIVMRSATGLRADGVDSVVTLSSGDEVRARSVILAGGVTYRLSGVPTVDALIGHGVFYGAAAGEAGAMAGLRVAVLGGGNSAGQAAAHLAAAGAQVTVLIRGGSLAKSMSEYLVQQLEGEPNITVRTRVQVVEALGDGQLTGLVLEAAGAGAQILDADALFVFIGARPHTDWLHGVIDLDDHDFITTGRDGAAWLETSLPGVFAAGDVRSGSIKRVAAAVGEGSTAAMLVREHLERRSDR